MICVEYIAYYIPNKRFLSANQKNNFKHFVVDVEFCKSSVNISIKFYQTLQDVLRLLDPARAYWLVTTNRVNDSDELGCMKTQAQKNSFQEYHTFLFIPVLEKIFLCENRCYKYFLFFRWDTDHI